MAQEYFRIKIQQLLMTGVVDPESKGNLSSPKNSNATRKKQLHSLIFKNKVSNDHNFYKFAHYSFQAGHRLWGKTTVNT